MSLIITLVHTIDDVVDNINVELEKNHIHWKIYAALSFINTATVQCDIALRTKMKIVSHGYT